MGTINWSVEESIGLGLMVEHMHAGRALALEAFGDILNSPSVDVGSGIRIASIGGTERDPELALLRSRGVVAQHTSIGLDEQCDYTLNICDSGLPPELQGAFDLILCSQVLEHLLFPQAAMRNVMWLLRPGGYAWIACPASNMYHESPILASAGYQPEYMEALAVGQGLHVISSGSRGNERLYKMTHCQQFWPSRRVLDRPWERGFHGRSPALRIGLFIKYLPQTLRAITWSRKDSPCRQWHTESFIALRKSVS